MTTESSCKIWRGGMLKLFNQMKKKWRHAVKTQHLHRGYGSFLAQQASIYVDLMRILGEPDARDKERSPD